MKQLQRGFTLIELMIVVAIIGILAAVAIPSYNDYTARAQVTEAVGLSSGFKTPMAEWYADRGAWPSWLTKVGSTLNGKYVSTMTIDTGRGATGKLIITATMKTAVNPKVATKVFALGTTSAGSRWTCGKAAGVTGVSAATTIENKYLPGSCKQ